MSGGVLFGRWARLVIGNLEIPHTLKFVFQVTKNLQGQPNTASIDVYNLNPAHRAEIEQTVTPDRKIPRLKIFPVSLEAGYGESGENASQLFLGHLRTFLSTREGPDIVTHIASGDGELPIRKARVNLSFQPGTPPDVAFRKLASSLGVDEGNLEDAVKLIKARQIFPRGTVFSGSAAREMDAICRSLGLEWSIQNNKLQILERGKALKGRAILLNKDSGMIGEPSIDPQGIVSVKSLMIPDVFPGRLMVIQGERLKGQYRIIETTHNGDTMGGDWSIDIKGQRY